MTNTHRPPDGELLLGIEAGGTRTVALLGNGAGVCLRRVETGPANLRLLNDRALARHFKQIARTLPRPSALAIGMAGARTEQDRTRIRQAAAAAWPGVPCLATNDLETALMAADGPSTGSGQAPGRRVRTATAGAAKPQVRVLVLSGTGSCCFGRTEQGRTAKVG